MKIDYNELERRYGHKLPKRGRGRPSEQERKDRFKRLMEIANTGSTKKPETPEQRVKRIQERFNIMSNLTDGIIDGQVRALIISGAPGIGKTHTIEEKLLGAKDMGVIRYKIIRAKLTPIELYMKLHQYRQENDVLLLDDTDSIFDEETGLNVLKTALDTGRQRTISWYSQTAALSANGVPSNFEYNGRLIVITNIDFQGEVDIGKGKRAPHLRALLSRCHYLDTQLHEPADLAAWTCHAVKKYHILEQHGITAEQEREAVQWLQKNYERMTEISIRSLLKISIYMQMDYASWKATAENMLCRK